MKPSSFLFLLMLFFGRIPHARAQSPQSMSFQSVVRDGNGQLVVSSPVQVRVSVLQVVPDTMAVYQETHTANATEHGRVNLFIGQGNATIGAFNEINWGVAPSLLKIEMDLTNTNNYTLMSISSFLSVPYALHVTTADDVLEPFVETDDVFQSHLAAGIVEQDTARWYQSIDPIVSGEGIEVNGATVSVLQELSVGDWWMGGRVVAVWKENGEQHGLIAANGPLPELRPYSNVTGTFVGTNAWSSDNGAQNSAAIIAQPGHANSAALGCATYSDGTWYLPSILELQTVFQQRWIFEQSGVVIPESYYWSSTEFQFSDQGVVGYTVQNLLCFTGTIAAISKFNNSYVWPVKRF